MPERLKHIICLDAALPVVDKAARDMWPLAAVAAIEKSLVDGFKLGSLPPEWFGVPPTDQANCAWVKRRLTGMPYGVFKTQFPEMSKDNTESAVRVRKTFVECNDGKPDRAKLSLEMANAQKMNNVAIKSGHDAMITAPQMLQELLLKIA